MSWVKRLGGRLPDFEDVVRRFPVAVVTMAIATIWLIYQIHTEPAHTHQEYVFGGFILAGYMAVSGHLIGESRKWSGLKSALLAIGLALPAFLICAYGKSLNFIFPMAIGAAILFLGSAAAWRHSRDDASVWNFTQKLWTGAIFAAVGSVIFAAGMFIISEAVKALFGFSLEDLTVKTLLPIGLVFLAPVYWLGTLPRYGEAEDVAELSFEARALSFLGTWMLAPLVTIYALIILAYGAKVLVQWELPKGEIALLVSPFLGVGMLVWLMLEPKVLKEGAFVRFYRAAWHWSMLPVAILLGVAVFVRIREYGVTPMRFFLALIVIWAMAQSLWFIIGPNLKRDIRIPTALAAGLLMFGAFAAEQLSSQSQFNLANRAKAQLPSFDSDSFRKNPKLAKQFLGGLRYIVRQKDETRFKRLLPEKQMPNSIYGPEYNAIIKTLGLDNIKEENNRRRSTRRVRFSLASKQPLAFSADSKVYSASSISLFNSRNHYSAPSIVRSQNGRNVVLSIEGETYRVNFDDALSDIKLIGEDNDNIDIVVQSLSIQSENGVSAKLQIIDGSLSYQEGGLIGGNLSFVVVLPH